LARASYRLRDDDNIYLGQIEAELLRALVEAKRRSRKAAGLRVATTTADQFVQVLVDPGFRLSPKARASGGDATLTVKARQLVGQPAGEGVAVGPARVVERREDLLDFKQGEILICDAVDPNMTFVAPLAAGVVERRGGMLIHGAIIAREYGLPCITGVPDVCQAVMTGDRITVDGYLGIVTVSPAPTDPVQAMPARPKHSAV
jgi:pyruvate,water dikinase